MIKVTLATNLPPFKYSWQPCANYQTNKKRVVNFRKGIIQASLLQAQRQG